MLKLIRPFRCLLRPVLRRLLPLALLTTCWATGAIGLYVFLLDPAENRLAAIEESYRASRAMHARQQASRLLQEEMVKTKRELDRFWTLLPTHHEFASLAVAISELGKSTGVSIPGMQHTVEHGEKGFPAKGTLTFRATGKFDDLYEFIRRVETADSYLVIEGLDVSRATAGSTSRTPLLEFSIKVVTFLRPDPVLRGES
jgi:Tfp pilus assembly protein PilO